MVHKALIIAAGNGSRLRQGSDLPKPLHRVAGLSLIERIILTSKKAGIDEFIVVVGYQKEKIIKELKKMELGVRLTFVENPDWQKPNGLSVLAAQGHLKEDFILLMSDHLFEEKTLSKLARMQLGSNRVILAVDTKTDQIFDPEDATKVLTREEKILKIGKELSEYTAVDTGMFLCSPALFQVLDECQQDQKFSLSDGMQLLASRGELGTLDIGDAFWQDVDTVEALAHAESYLFKQCRKPTDGWISRNFNRYISLWITRQILKTNLSANHVTGLTSVVGILSGVFVARGDYWNILLGTFLFKLASILDGCDGEISKLKMTQSRMGQWLDTASDNLTYVVFLVGVIVGVARTGAPNVALTGSLTLFGLFMTLSIMFAYLLRNTNSGSLLAVEAEFNKQDNSRFKKIFGVLRYLVKRDFFALGFFVLGIFGRLDWILFLFMVGTNTMWVVLLKTLFTRKAETVMSRS